MAPTVFGNCFHLSKTSSKVTLRQYELEGNNTILVKLLSIRNKQLIQGKAGQRKKRGQKGEKEEKQDERALTEGAKQQFFQCQDDPRLLRIEVHHIHSFCCYNKGHFYGSKPKIMQAPGNFRNIGDSIGLTIRSKIMTLISN